MGRRSAGCETKLAVGRPAFFVPLTILSLNVPPAILSPARFGKWVWICECRNRTRIDHRDW
jgi:hypothetical protein